MKAIDGFEFEMKVFWLLHCSFQVYGDNGFKVFEFSEKLEYAFVADLSDGDFDASEVEDHLAQ